MLRKIFSAVFSRMFIVVFLLILQIALLLATVFYLSALAMPVYFFLTALSVMIVIAMCSKQYNPSYRHIWTIVILAFPLVGGVFYLLFGGRRTGRRMERGLRAIFGATRGVLAQEQSILTGLERTDPQLFRQAEYIRRVGECPVFANTETRYFPSGEALLDVFLRELKRAEKFIFLEYFIISDGKMWDAVLKILREKAQKGLDVRLIYDDLGSIGLIPENFRQKLERLGIKAVVFNPFRPLLNPFMNNRDHRKICVIDGNVGFTGGINIGDEYINEKVVHGHWKDTAVMLRGDAVWSLTVMFLQIWNFVTGEVPHYPSYMPGRQVSRSDGYVQPYADMPLDDHNLAANVYLNIISRAERYVYITTPYLILDNELLTALACAANSGVDVRIVTPGIGDKWFVHYVTQSYYSELVSAGVKIYEYTPGFIHAKMFVADDKTAVVGTVNLDYRSLYLHFECACAFYCSSVVRYVRDDITKTIQASKRVTMASIKKTRWYKRAIQSVLRVVAPLM